jgi:hypothetical protein
LRLMFIDAAKFVSAPNPTISNPTSARRANHGTGQFGPPQERTIYLHAI